jgi:hypothetical protein
MMDSTGTAVFVQTNDAASNQVVVFGRGEDGALRRSPPMTQADAEQAHRTCRRRARSSPPTGESSWQTPAAMTSPFS